jgi:hypothetical protein
MVASHGGDDGAPISFTSLLVLVLHCMEYKYTLLRVAQFI